MARKIHNENIAWLLHCGFAAMGECSGLGGIVAVLERGGVSTASESPEWNHDEESVRRAGRLLRIWKRLSARTQQVHLAHYTASMRVQEGSGKRGFAKFPPGVAGNMTDPPGVALLLANEAGRLDELLAACAEPRAPGAKEFIREWEAQALIEQQIAHREWDDLERLQAVKWVDEK